MASGGYVKNGDDGVPAGFCSEGSINLEVDGLGECVGFLGE